MGDNKYYRKKYEEFHKVKLEPHQVIHHKDHNRKNNDINNLEVMDYSEHSSMHHAGVKKPKHKKQTLSKKKEPLYYENNFQRILKNPKLQFEVNRYVKSET